MGIYFKVKATLENTNTLEGNSIPYIGDTATHIGIEYSMKKACLFPFFIISFFSSRFRFFFFLWIISLRVENLDIGYTRRASSQVGLYPIGVPLAHSFDKKSPGLLAIHYLEELAKT